MIVLLPLSIARAIIRSLQTQRRDVPLLWKITLGIALVAVFAPLWAGLRLWAMLGGTVRVSAEVKTGERPIVFDCDLPDLIQTYLYLFGIWEPDVSAFVQRRLRSGGTFIDIGAHVGYFTLLAAGPLGPRGKVIAIEASPDTYEAMRNNLALNDIEPTVRTVNMAVSDTEATLDIYGGPSHNLGLTSTRRHRGMKFMLSVPAAPLEKILTNEELREARLIKIDVEGGEDAVLAGIAACLEHLRDDVEILVELSPTWWDDCNKTPREVLAPFVDAGFNVYEIPNDYWPWRYLWPRCIERQCRITGSLDQRVARLDIVLSRADSGTL